MRRTPRRLAPALALVALAFAACGGDDDAADEGDTGAAADEGSGGSGEDRCTLDGEPAVEVGALDSLAWEPSEVEAPAGEIGFRMVNEGSLPHTFVIEGREDDLKLEVSGNGDVDECAAELEAGEYVFYCDVPGHRSAGMEGTLTVG